MDLPSHIFLNTTVSPLGNEPRLVVKSKPLDCVTIDKMEQALERSKRLKSLNTSMASTSGAQTRDEEKESSSEEDEVDETKEEIEALRKEIADIKLRQEGNFKATCD